MTYARVAMSINTNNREGRKAFFVWTSSGSVASASIIIALTLVLAGGFALLSQTSMTIPNALAQEDANDTTTTAETTTTDDTTTTTEATTTMPSSGLELSPQPIWDEQATSTSVTPINETHRVATFIGNGTMTVPNTRETINMTNNGTAFISFVPGYAETVSAYGREYVFSEDDNDTTAITFNEIIRYNPETFEGSGLVIAVFDNNATGSLAPFNGMLVVGTHEEDPSTQAATIRLWEWESGIPIPTMTGAITPTLEESSAPPPPMGTPTAEDLTADDSTATTTTTIPIPEEEGEGQ